MTVGFGPEAEVFQYSVFIVLVNRLVTCAVAAMALKLLDQSLAPSAPLLLFAVPSVANVVGSSAQYEALKYVSFPLQALAKCAKSVRSHKSNEFQIQKEQYHVSNSKLKILFLYAQVPVMAWSWVTQTRKYNANDYLSAATVTLGCVLFVLTGDITAPSLINPDNPSAAASALSFTTVGITLLAIFMIFDGLTCTSQDKLFSSYDMHSCNQLLYTAAWSAVLSLAFLGLSGQIWGALGFVVRHPDSLWLMLLQSVVSTTVQLFIVFTIKQYGALNFALMMTLRQFLSIVLSCLVFQHNLSGMQWAGTLLVIGGLVSRSMEKVSGRKGGGGGGGGIGGQLETVNSGKLKGKQPGSPRNSMNGMNGMNGGGGVSVGDGENQQLLSDDFDVGGSLSPGKSHTLENRNTGTASSLSSSTFPDHHDHHSPAIKNGSQAPIPGHPLTSVLHPLGNVLTSPLRGNFRSPLVSPYHGSGDYSKVKPG